MQDINLKIKKINSQWNSKNIIEKIKMNLSRKDNFTGVYNRDYFFCLLENKKNGTFIKVKVMGVNFVNLHCGIKEGDKIIKNVAKGLKDMNCNAVVSRLSSVKFAIYTEETDTTEIKKIIKNILKIISNLNDQEKNINISANVAAVIYKDDNFCIEDSINKLEISMSNAIRKGKNKYEIYNEKYENYININTIEKAMEDDEIVLYYQPKVDAKTGEIKGVEALVRWFNKEHGYISPDKLIGFAEKSGYINTLGKWIIRKACKEIHDLNKKLNKEIGLSVNISPYQLEDKNFISDITQIVKEEGFDYNLLKLEITENENVEEIDRIYEVFENIKKTGIKVSIDDFGKGFNSIDYIKNYNVDEIKIDKSLVEYLSNNPEFIASLINMIHTTDTDVVAEGVEQKNEFMTLKNMGCDLIQGYYCYKPMELEALIKTIDLNIG